MLIAAQAICAAFFLWDVGQDFNESGITLASNAYGILELFAAVLLVAAIIFELRYLQHILRRNSFLEENMSLAALAMHDIVKHMFSQWDLTKTEDEVGMLMVKGFSISEIARIRGSAEGTIKAHLNAIYRKSGTSSRAEVLSLLIDPLMATPLLENEQ
jgi:DNA-binding NarL/FixJ family response regulator